MPQNVKELHKQANTDNARTLQLRCFKQLPLTILFSLCWYDWRACCNSHLTYLLTYETWWFWAHPPEQCQVTAEVQSNGMYDKQAAVINTCTRKIYTTQQINKSAVDGIEITNTTPPWQIETSNKSFWQKAESLMQVHPTARLYSPGQRIMTVWLQTCNACFGWGATSNLPFPSASNIVCD